MFFDLPDDTQLLQRTVREFAEAEVAPAAEHLDRTKSFPYELVRQMIDATDESEGLFVAVQLPPVLVNDEARGLAAYTALQLRVADEVRDRQRPNPYAALVRIGLRGQETE